MTGGQIATAFAYASLASVVVAVNWRRPMRTMAFALLTFTVVSSVTFFIVPFEVRLLREVVLASLVSSVAMTLWACGDDPRSQQFIALFAMLDMTFCAALFIIGPPYAPFHRSLFGWTVNTLFVGMCISAAVPGIRDALGIGVRDRGDIWNEDHAVSRFDGLLQALDEDR
jgi:hypothetical protein